MARSNKQRTGSPPWLFGPALDLLLGCGVGYLLLAAGLGLLPVAANALTQWGVLATFVVGMAHYGATLVRVYETSEDRRKYAFFTVWASLAVWSVFVVGIYAPLVGSLLLTVYLNWSPWHYAGQNYGLAVMFLRRRNVEVDATLKRVLYASFVSSTALSLLTLNAANESALYVPLNIDGIPYQMLKLGIPGTVYQPAFAVVLALHVATLGTFAVRVLQRAGAATLLPAFLLLLTQALWFSVPSIAVWATGVRVQTEYVFFFFLWAGIGHSVQYLWVTTYYAAGGRPLAERARYLGKTLLAGAIIFTVPAVLFAPNLLGSFPYELGLATLIASAVNIQHFILDGAIWKLRDGPVARILLARGPRKRGAKGAPTPALPPPTGPAARWSARAVWSAGAVCAVVAIGSAWEYERGWITATARSDHERAQRAERWLTWVGRDQPRFHERRAARALARGETEVARREFEAAVALHPTVESLQQLATLQAQAGDGDAALESLSRGFALFREAADSDRAAGYLGGLDARQRQLEVAALTMAGRHWLDAGDAAQARHYLDQAARRSPGGPDPGLQALLRRAAEAGGSSTSP